MSRSKVTYKTVEGADLHLFCHHPVQPNGAAIVFFHGGGWRGGTPHQFDEQCKYLASRGMLAATAEYRLLDKGASSIRDCVADAKSAIRWVRKNAENLKIDSGRIAAGGGSAGGYLAACTAIIDGFEDEDTDVSSKPQALVLFNPAIGFRDARELDPAQHISENAPPTIIFHGTTDTTVPFENAAKFCKLMKDSANTCELVPFEGQEHGFFNYNIENNKAFFKTMVETDIFLSELGFLSGPPTLKFENVKHQVKAKH